ncbi:hypothetical protein [Pseudorhodoferax sp. Leaf274]|uniref:hypothetical protein n=1 Tax=Pseudorhodoferax sp. Leaf274 TaxID=1736318 RepID=UPI0007037A10|nr:hypothetical protein [Pseudorhodoferax sp. Leaf274]KQP35857.1 hypothetical protein ASF44_21410 [Pseudorhodoferax sp. Leaf274]
MTDAIVLFNPPRIAEEIGGHQGDALAVMKTCNQTAVDEAVTWFHQGGTTEPWPLAEPGSRGERLVDLRTEQLCENILEAAQRVAGGTEEQRAEALNHWHRQLLDHMAGGMDFERRQFHRDEIARWLKAMGLKSNYQFGASAAPGQEAQPATTGTTKRWTEDGLAALKAYRAEHGTKETAKHFGITEQRVRELLPQDKKSAGLFAGLGGTSGA